MKKEGKIKGYLDKTGWRPNQSICWRTEDDFNLKK